MTSWQARAVTLLGSCLGVAVVTGIDIATGSDIQIEALYFLPLMLAGWRLPRAPAAAVALLATLAWMAAQHANGSHPVALHVWVINFLTQGTAYLIVTVLVTRLARKLADEQALRRTDLTTGLLSRSGFIERADLLLALCRRRARPVCLAYIDLDHFKTVNDNLGHAHGDALLREFGTIIAACIRDTDAAGRIGGDEFVLLLPETDRAETMTVCQRIVRMLETSPEFRGAGVTASIGVIVDDQARLDTAELLRLADAEMYAVKRGGRNNVTAARAGDAARGAAAGSDRTAIGND